MRMMKAGQSVRLQIALAPVGVGGVFAIAPGAGRGQRGVLWSSIQKDRVGLAPGRGAASQCGVLRSPMAVGRARS